MERDPSTTKIMPHDLQAEGAILGGLMLDNNSLADVLEVLSRDGEDFYNTANKILFGAIATLIDQYAVADTITVCDYLRASGNLDKIGGFVFVSEIMDNAISAVNIKHYAKIVKQKATERLIISESSRLIESAYNPIIPTEEILQEAQKTILSLSLTREKNSLQSSYSIASRTHKTIEERYERKSGMVVGIPTKFDRLDDITGGMIRGDLWVIAARPGMGKSALAVDIAYHAALDKYKAAIFSLEMPADSLMIRILSSMARIDSRLLSRGYVTNDQWPKLTQAAGAIGEAPLYIDDKADITPTEILAKCRRLKSDSGLDLVVVDYLQLMKIPGHRDSREQQVAEISRSMKMLARELEVPVIALSQLNRNVEQQNNKRPGLGDLRESGAIEQDADVIAFIYRDEVYNRDSPEKGIAEIIIGKHRNGPTGAVKLSYLEKFTRFENIHE
jgi:replicative DNA helicase